MIRLLSISFCLLIAAGCATSGVSGGVSGSGDQKTKEYEALKEGVSTVHAHAVFGADQAWIFTPETIETYPKEFAKTTCTPATAQDCGSLFSKAVFNALSKAYFAADTTAVNRKCEDNPLICNDLMALEALFRNLHNASIEASKEEKLASLEEWRRGQLTDDQLEAILHFQFKFEKGQLSVSLQ